jgi:dTDP-4-dehydrorhamnose reductase
MKIAVTGAEGTIGSELVRRGCTPINIDVTNSELIRNEIEYTNPDVLIHCAALTDVDYCEEHFKESFEVNVRGTSNVVEAMPKNSLFIYLSSDHVFSGDNWNYEGYGEKHALSPVNRYGFSKWGGELAANTGICRTIIVRSSKCFNYAWTQPTIEKLKNNEVIVLTDLIKRSFYHVNHFVDGLLYLAHNYERFSKLDIINISGHDILSYYLFWSSLKSYLQLLGTIKPRREEVKEETPRPFRAGLEIRQARKLGIPLYTLIDGFELIKQGI